MIRHRLHVLVVVLAVMVSTWPAGAPAVADRMLLSPAGFKDITGWASENHAEALAAFLKSCEDFSALEDGEAIGKEQLLAPATVWKAVCRKASLVPPNDEVDARKFLEEQFVPMRLTTDEKDSVFITGYYEPLLNGSCTKKRPFVYPVYALPDHPIFYTRKEIDKGFLGEYAKAIAYVDDPVQLFFLHVQGSGGIRTDCGNIMRVGFAGNNNQPYVSIGKVLVDRGEIEKKNISMQSIRKWLYDHPKEMWQTLWQNPSYIFFHEMKGGPLGTEKVELTPNRSLAVDRNYIPLGMPVFVDTVVPGVGEAPFTLWHKLMVAQDTGRAIEGPMRGDIFFGSGYAAEEIAGRMQAGGTFILFVPHEIANKLYH